MLLGGPAVAGHPTRELGHLTYCTNIHAGEPLDELMASLARHLPSIKAQVSPQQPFGVGLRIGNSAAQSLRDPAALQRLKNFLIDGGYYCFTINGFPYGAFHGQAVKENAYAPDWSDPLRLAYTDHLADILSALLPEGQDGSVSTVPGTYKPWALGRMDAIVDHLILHVAHLTGIRAKTGQTISLALEPEPECLLETILQAVEFFKQHLFSCNGVARLAALTGLSNGEAEAAMRRHIGLCYDVCHAAVEFEDAKASIDLLRAEGILVAKLQLSSALRLAQANEENLGHLAAFAEPVYLHQVVQKQGGVLIRFADLPQALAEAHGANKSGLGAEWRVHFHVPLFLDRMAHFDTTQAFLKDILALHRAQPISAHLEVETYTWDVLPQAYRNVDLSSAIAREINWVKAELGH